MQHLSLAAQAASDPGTAHTRRQLAAIGSLVAKSSKVIVVSGAGVSCSCGIPDFRSADGLYNLVKARYPSTFVTGKDLFSSSLFRSADSTALFFSFIAELKAAVDGVEPSRTHRFVRRLEERGKLARCYTQNIDGLERRAGVQCSSSVGEEPKGKGKGKAKAELGGPDEDGLPASSQSSAWSASFPFSSQTSAALSRSPSPPPSSFASSSTSPPPSSDPAADDLDFTPTPLPPPSLDKRSTRNVQLHGDLHALRCTTCAASYAFADEWVALYKEGECVQCPACEAKSAGRRARGQRALSKGVLRPAIVLYDENHPSGDLIGDLQSYDIQRAPDLLLVLGTSLKVHGLKRLVKELAKAVHALPATKARPEGGKGRVVFVNKTPPGKEWDGVFDTWVEGECDAWVDGVEKEWRRVKRRDWEEQTTLTGALGKAVKVGVAAAGKAKGKPVAAGKAKREQGEMASPLPKLVAKRALSSAGVPPAPARSPTSPPAAAAHVFASSQQSTVPPSSPLSTLPSSPAHAQHAAPLAVNYRTGNFPRRPPTPPGADPLRSPTKKQRLNTPAGRPARARAARAQLSDDEDEGNNDDQVHVVEEKEDELTPGTIKYSPPANTSSSSSTPRRPPPPSFKLAPSTTSGGGTASTPRAALPSTANGARKRPPGTPVTKSPFMVKPPPPRVPSAGGVGTVRAGEGVLGALGKTRKVDVVEGVL